MTSNGKKLQKNTNGNTTLDKESIVELMKTTFEGEFAKQQQQISKIIENNLVITKQEIGKLREEINDLKKSIEFTENVLEEKVAKVEQNVCGTRKTATLKVATRIIPIGQFPPRKFPPRKIPSQDNSHPDSSH